MFELGKKNSYMYFLEYLDICECGTFTTKFLQVKNNNFKKLALVVSKRIRALEFYNLLSLVIYILSQM